MRHPSRLAGLLVGLVPFSFPAVAIAQPLNIAELRSEYLPPTTLAGERPMGTTPWSDAEDVQVLRDPLRKCRKFWNSAAVGT